MRTWIAAIAALRRGALPVFVAVWATGLVQPAGTFAPTGARGQKINPRTVQANPRTVQANPRNVQANIVQIFGEMASQGRQFEPSPLHALGLEGLCIVMDRLLPDTADGTTPGTLQDMVARLVEQLGDDRYRTREAAGEALYQIGPLIRSALIAATRNADAEIGWRATRILRKWDSQQRKDEMRHVAAMGTYLQGVEDDVRLAEVARRVVVALKPGMPSGPRRELIKHCLTALAGSGNDIHSNMLRPLLQHADVQVAVMVTETIGGASRGDSFPAILLDALRANRGEVVSAALRWAPRGGDALRRDELERLLLTFFEGDDEELKFQACFPLMQGFEYAGAVDYLLLQVQGDDRGRRARALSWLGDASNHGRPAGENLLRILGPLLKSEDYGTRLGAARALAMYSGEEVVKSLVPLLDDPKAAVSTEIGYRLLQQIDHKMLRRVLAAVAKDDPNENVRKKAAAVVDQLRIRQ